MDLTKHRLDNFITVGKILDAYGLHGQIKVDVYFEDLKLLRTFKEFFLGNSQLKTKIKFLKKSKKSIWIASFAETKNKEQAEDLKGQLIFLEKRLMPKLMANEFYYEDLKGLQIKIDGSVQKGIVKDVFNFGSGDLLEVSLDERNQTIYIPFNRENVSSIDLANRTIIVTPMKGLLT